MLKLFLKSFYHKYFRFKKFKVLGRTACLGNEVIKQMGWSENYVNHQKSRVDYLLELSVDKSIAPISTEIINYLKHKYIIGTIEHQRYNFFRYSNPDIIVVDSYSELTDQLFVDTGSNKKFLVNYSDIDQHLLPKRYECRGLIEKNLFEIYDSFFAKINLVYPRTPLYYIHFSTILDNRDKFINRGKIIIEIINKLSIKYKFIKIIKINDDLIHRANSDNEEFNNLPYHYSEETYKQYILEFQKIYKNE